MQSIIVVLQQQDTKHTMAKARITSSIACGFHIQGKRMSAFVGNSNTEDVGVLVRSSKLA